MHSLLFSLQTQLGAYSMPPAKNAAKGAAAFLKSTAGANHSEFLLGRAPRTVCGHDHGLTSLHAFYQTGQTGSNNQFDQIRQDFLLFST